MWRRPRVLLALAAAVLASVGGAGASPAQAATYGLSDGHAEMLDAPAFMDVEFRHARLVLPWNAASQRGSWDAWLDRSLALGVPVLLSMNVDAASSCTGGSCTGPSVSAYRSELATLLARYPNVDAVEPWNEPNHVMQPTRSNPGLAADYFDAAFDLCAGGRCIAVAGNMLDAPSSLPSYFTAYRNALGRTPAAWGLHSYYDTTYFSDDGLRYLLGRVSTPVWITETGGMLRFQPAGGGGLQRSEAEAALSVDWLFTLAEDHPRLARTYFYGLWEEPANGFDSALLWADGAARQSYLVLAGRLGPRRTRFTGPAAPMLPPSVGGAQGAGVSAGAARPGGAGGAGAAANVVMARVIGKRVAVGRSRAATVRVRCLGTARCRVRVQLRIDGWRKSRVLSVAAGKTRKVRVKVPAARYRKLRRLGKSTHTVTLCPALTPASSSAPPLACAPPVRLARATR